MDWDELEPLLDRLEDTRRPAEVTDTIRKAKKNIQFNGKFGAFIKMIILKEEGIKPKLNVVPPSKRIPLGPLLEEGWIWGNKGAFDHRDNPHRMLDFCDPYSTKRNKYLDEMSEHQSNMIEMISEDIRRAKAKANKKKDLFAEPDNIEDALDNAIKAGKRKREEGNDPA